MAFRLRQDYPRITLAALYPSRIQACQIPVFDKRGEPLKVLFAHNDYGKFSGEEAAIESIARLLENEGHQVVWFRKSSADIGDSVTAKARAFSDGIYSQNAYREVGAVLDREQPDLVQIQNLYPFLSPSIVVACKERGLPVVMRCPNYRLFCPSGLHLRSGEICERCLGPGRELNCILYNCESSLAKSTGYALRGFFARKSRILLDKVDTFFVLSEFQKQRFQDAGLPERKLTILPNYSTLVEAHALPESPGGSVSYIGRLSLEKGIQEFLEAAKSFPDTPFEVAGSANPAVESLVRDVPPNVRLLGFLKGADLDALYARSRIVVCPSRCFEGFPNIVARAMAHRRPVIGSDIGVIPEIIDDGETGLLFPPKDTNALVQAIDNLLRDDSACLAMGRRGQKKVRNLYSEQRVTSILLDAYRRLLPGTPA